MRNLITYLLCLMTFISYGQEVADVLRFSQTSYLGSTRYMASGGAFTALGNDFTAAHLNPAGLAVFRRSEVNLALGIVESGIHTEAGRDYDIQRPVLMNFGFLNKSKKGENWETAVGVSINRMADFNMVYGAGEDASTSILASWIQRSNGTDPYDLDYYGLNHEAMAWDAYLLDADANNVYSTQANWSNGIERQYQVEQKGSINELAFTLAAENNHKLYIGASFNVSFLNYQRKSSYFESGFEGDSIVSFSVKEFNKISGMGLNAKFGMIYRFDNNFRVGVALHTPTAYTLNQEWEDEINVVYSHSGNMDSSIVRYNPGYYWDLLTPTKLTLGIAQVFGTYGFISMDYEYNPIRAANASSDSVDIRYLNPEIDREALNFHTFKVGGEIKIHRVYLRAGYNLTLNKLHQWDEDKTFTMVSAGLGYRGKNLSVEASMAKREASINRGAGIASSELVYAQTPFVLSVSYRFD